MSSEIYEIDGDDLAFLTRRERPVYESGPKPVRLVDLFAGSGGLTLGVAEACRHVGRGLQVRLSMELDERIRSVYDLNFRSKIKHDRADVRSRFNRRVGEEPSPEERRTCEEVGKVDILVGGPPCQGHSDLNNHTRRRDEKNELYLVMVRAAELLKPTYVVIENVQGVRRDHGAVLARAKEELRRLDYEVAETLVHMVDLGVPQKRVRHILVAALGRPVEGVLDIPPRGTPRPLRWAIDDLQGRQSDSIFDSPARLTPDNLRRAQYFLDHKDEYDLPNPLRPPCHRDNPGHRYTAMYGRLKWDEPAHTITTGFGSPGQGRYLHPAELRTLTPHEAARVQFFPDWFAFGEGAKRGVLAHCIGNAVPPKLAFSVVMRLPGWTAVRTASKAAGSTQGASHGSPPAQRRSEEAA